jgi:hypothetical protein
MIDLNALMPLSYRQGDYGVLQPDNAWPDAGERVTLFVFPIGTKIVQIGWSDADPGKAMMRARTDGSPHWGAWTEIEPPPEPQSPILATLNPNTAEVGAADLTLTANGANFTQNSVIVFNGGEEATTFVSAAELTTIVKPSLASGAATVPVLIRDADLESVARDFTFAEPEG